MKQTERKEMFVENTFPRYYRRLVAVVVSGSNTLLEMQLHFQNSSKHQR
jgi:hypothetical protein